MEYHEKARVEKQYVISESLVRRINIAILIASIAVIILTAMFLYIFFRVEGSHYPSRIITDLDIIARGCK